MLDPISSFLNCVSNRANTIAAGFIGALISLHFVTGLSKWEHFTTVLCGAGVSQFLAHPLAQYFHLDMYEQAIGFLMGLFGLSLCATLFRGLRDADVWGFIRSKLGG